MNYVHDRDERGLTAKQREIEKLLNKGLTVREIAHKLGVTKSRVYFVVQQLREKGIV